MTGYVIFDGYNSTANDGDEVDGAGINESVWAVYFDSFVPLRPFVVTAEMAAAFDQECPDFVAPCNDNLVMVPAEPETIVIRGR